METLICGNLVLALMKNPMPSAPSAVMVQQPGKDALPRMPCQQPAHAFKMMAMKPFMNF